MILHRLFFHHPAHAMHYCSVPTLHTCPLYTSLNKYTYDPVRSLPPEGPEAWYLSLTSWLSPLNLNTSSPCLSQPRHTAMEAGQHILEQIDLYTDTSLS